MGNTSNVPASGAILVLDGNGGRKMHTGHPLFVRIALQSSTLNSLRLRFYRKLTDRKQ